MDLMHNLSSSMGHELLDECGGRCTFCNRLESTASLKDTLSQSGQPALNGGGDRSMNRWKKTAAAALLLGDRSMILWKMKAAAAAAW